MSRRSLNTILGLALLAALAYWLYPFLAGGSNMQSFCDKLRANAPRSEVERAVADAGFRLTIGEDQNGFVHDPRAFGRYICDVEFEGNRLVSARYFLND